MGVLVSELSFALSCSFPRAGRRRCSTCRFSTPTLLSGSEEWLDQHEFEPQLRYWKRQLAELKALELPTDKPRPRVRTGAGAMASRVIPAALSQALEELCRRENATLFMVMLAAYQVLLARYSGQDDIAVGSPIANRNRSEVEVLIGFFVNSLVMRTDLSGNPSFRELLRRVRETTLGAYAHQDLPFEKLVDELQPDRDLSQNPLFQATFAVQNAPLSEFQLPGLTVQYVDSDVTSTRFDLEFHVWEAEQELSLVAFYNTDLFERATIERMLGHYHNLLEASVANPSLGIAELPLLSARERKCLLEEWNDTAASDSRDPCFHELFRDQVERAPLAQAVVFGNERLTFEELDRRANRLAHRLRRLGVGPESRVGLCLERSLDMIVAVLGVLKAGGAYVPIAPDCPPQRFDFMLQDADVNVLLTQTYAALAWLPVRRQSLSNWTVSQSLTMGERGQSSPTSGRTTLRTSFTRLGRRECPRG